MKRLDELINAQSDSYKERAFTDKNLPKIRVHHLDNNCIWRNTDLHILCSDSAHINYNDGISFPVRRNIYRIIRMQYFVSPTSCCINSISQLQDVLKNVSPGYSCEFLIADDFDFDAVLKAARDRYAHGNRYIEKYSYSSKRENRYFVSRQKYPLEEISVEDHRKYYERRNMTVEEVAHYLEIPLTRAIELSHCPNFPIVENSRPKRTPVAALNSWLLENPEIFEIKTGSLVRYMKEKVAKQKCSGR